MRVARPGRERAATQAGVVAWLADYPAPSDFLELWFACGATFNAGTVCDPALDPRMAHAEALQAADPIAADAAWSAIDHTAADAALWVLLVDPREIELVSPRVGNYQYNALLGFLADQAWVR